MASLNGFDASTIEVDDGYEPLPAGRYEVIVASSEICPTRDGTGEYVKIELQVVSEEHKNRRLWDYLTIKHSKPLAAEIGRRKLAALCLAVGVPRPGDTGDLHDIPLEAVVGIKRRSDTGDLANVIKKYARLDGAPAQRPTVPPRPTRPSSSPRNSQDPPWKRS
jgi:hypothetical protein